MADPQGDPITVDVPNLGTVSFPAGTSEADMKKAIDAQIAQSHVAQGKDVPHPVVARLLDWLPAAGGMIGGAFGAAVGAPALGIGTVPGAIAGAMAGGVAGRTAQNTINAAIGNPAPRSIPEAMQSVGNAGLIQGGAEAVGQGTMAGLRPLAPSLMRSAMNPGVKVLEKTGELETAQTPRLVTTALDSGGTVTPRGVRTLVGARDAAVTAKDAIVANLGGQVSPSAVEQVAQGYADSLLVKADQKAAQRVVDEFTNQYVRDPATGQMFPGIAPTLADTLKTQYRQGINYGKMGKTAIEARKTIARGLKDGLEALDTTNTLGAANAKVGSLIDATQTAAVANAMWKNKPLAMRTLSALAGKSPAINSMIAKGLYTSAERLAHIPAGTLMALGAVLSNVEDQQP